MMPAFKQIVETSRRQNFNLPFHIEHPAVFFSPIVPGTKYITRTITQTSVAPRCPKKTSILVDVLANHWSFARPGAGSAGIRQVMIERVIPRLPVSWQSMLLDLLPFWTFCRTARARVRARRAAVRGARAGTVGGRHRWRLGQGRATSCTTNH